MASRFLLLSAMLVTACGTPAGVRRFPLREAVWLDDDAHPFLGRCRRVQDDDDGARPRVTCLPEEYTSPFVWDGVDNMLFRPVARLFAVDPAGEAVNVNALDEVPDSSWFEGRIGRRAMTPEEIARGSCPEEPLDVDGPDGSWLVDRGKENGANPGFRVNVPGAGKFLLKADEPEHPERATGATAVATRLYHAAGYFTSCDSVIYVRRALFRLKPDLHYTDNTGIRRPFGEAQLETILAGASRHGSLYRLVASQWLPGPTLGPFRYVATRRDDPNDVVRHEDRRELRGQRLLAAWLNHFDSREQNSMNTWVAVDPRRAETSPGFVRHWILDMNDCFGSVWAWDEMSRRLGWSHYFDAPDIFQDLLTLGIPERPWERVQQSPEGDIFGYFEADEFDPEAWKPGYPNPAFLRMSERDGAWMARILARFERRHVEAAVSVGRFTLERHREVLLRVLLERRHKILARYFARVSPLADLETRGHDVCAVDLARATRTYDERAFGYRAWARWGDELELEAGLPVRVERNGRVCVTLPPAGGSGPDEDPSRYVRLAVRNGASSSPLFAYFYDTSAAGLRLVGVER